MRFNVYLKALKKIKIKIETIQTKLRRDWGKVRPVTFIMPDKTKYTRKIKHKGRE